MDWSVSLRERMTRIRPTWLTFFGFNFREMISKKNSEADPNARTFFLQNTYNNLEKTQSIDLCGKSDSKLIRLLAIAWSFQRIYQSFSNQINLFSSIPPLARWHLNQLFANFRLFSPNRSLLFQFCLYLRPLRSTNAHHQTTTPAITQFQHIQNWIEITL